MTVITDLIRNAPAVYALISILDNLVQVAG